MNPFYAAGWLAFSLIRLASLSLHFLGKTPYGSPVVEAPVRFLPNAAIFELGLLLCFALFFGISERLFRRPGLGFWRTSFLVFHCLWLFACQFDQEVVRWLGNHVTLGFVRTYYSGFHDLHLLARLIRGDIAYFSAAVFLGLLPIPVCAKLWNPHEKFPRRSSRKLMVALMVLAAIAVSFPFWWNYSSKRWRRICPAPISILQDGWRLLQGLDRPHHPHQAGADLASLVQRGELPSSLIQEPLSRYPLWRMSAGKYSTAEFQALPQSSRPNIVLIIFETFRGWRTGLAPDSSSTSACPALDSLIQSEAVYFPWTHSGGFPSVEGGVSIHLGLWPHYGKVILSQYIHIRTRSLPEILRDAGYHTEILFGYDPSFDNFTPWMNKCYDRLEHNPANVEDGPLLKRATSVIDTLSKSKPWMLAVWTTSTHPPYDVPASERGDQPPPSDPDERYDQTLAYSSRELLRFFAALKARPDWNRTLVVMVGDHSQPNPWQALHVDQVGEFNPGHTWTQLAFFGGWPGLRARGLRRVTASQMDIGPTLLGVLDLKTSHHFMGRDLISDSAERTVVTARNDGVALIRDDHRLLFRMDGNPEVSYYHLSHESKKEYGLLEGHLAVPGPPPVPSPFGAETERYRDMLRAYGTLLDEDRIMPPGPP